MSAEIDLEAKKHFGAPLSATKGSTAGLSTFTELRRQHLEEYLRSVAARNNSTGDPAVQSFDREIERHVERNLEGQLSEAQISIHSLTERLENQRQQNECLTRQLAECQSRVVEKLHTEIEELRLSLLNAQQQLHEIQREKEVNASEEQQLLAERGETIRILTQQLQEREQSLLTASGMPNQLVRQNTELLEQVRTKSEEINRVVSERKKEKLEYRQRVDQLELQSQMQQQQLKATGEAMAKAETRIRALEEEKRGLEQRLEQERTSRTKPPGTAEYSGAAREASEEVRPEPSPKRRRLEEESAPDRSDLNRETITSFFVYGQQQIHDLKEQCAKLQLECEAGRKAKEELDRMKTHRLQMVDSLVALSTDVEKARDAEKSARALLAQKNVEAAMLEHYISVLVAPGSGSSCEATTGEESDSLNGSTQRVNIASLLETVRRAAALVAAQNSHNATLFDQEAMLAAAKQAQALRHEVSMLQKDKDKLLELIRRREKRLGAVNEQIATLQLNTAAGALNQFQMHEILRPIVEEFASSSSVASVPETALGQGAPSGLAKTSETTLRLYEKLASQKTEIEDLQRQQQLYRGRCDELLNRQRFLEQKREAEREGFLTECNNLRTEQALLLNTTSQFQQRISTMEKERDYLRRTALSMHDAASTILTFLEREVQSMQSLREERETLRAELRKYKASGENELWKSGNDADSSALATTIATISSFCDRADQLLVVLRAQNDTNESASVSKAVKMVQQKDALLKSQSDECRQLHAKLLEKIRELQKQLVLRATELEEQTKWGSVMEQKARGAHASEEVAKRELSLLRSLQQAPAHPSGAAAKPPTIPPGCFEGVRKLQETEEHILAALRGVLQPVMPAIPAGASTKQVNQTEAEMEQLDEENDNAGQIDSGSQEEEGQEEGEEMEEGEEEAQDEGDDTNPGPQQEEDFSSGAVEAVETAEAEEPFTNETEW